MRLLIRPALWPSVLNLLRYVLDGVLTKFLGRPKLLAVLIVVRVRAVSLRLQSFTGASLGKLKAHPLLSRGVLYSSEPCILAITLRVCIALHDSSELVLLSLMLRGLDALRFLRRILARVFLVIWHIPVSVSYTHLTLPTIYSV